MLRMVYKKAGEDKQADAGVRGTPCFLPLPRKRERVGVRACRVPVAGGSAATGCARQVEKFLQALLEAEKLVPVVRVRVEHLQAFTEVSQGIEGVSHVGAPVLTDVLEHLDPGGEFPREDKVEGGQVESGDLSHRVAVEHLEGQLIAPLLALWADKVHSEGGVDKAEAAETGFVLSHEGLQGLEKSQGGERYFLLHFQPPMEED